MTVPDMSPLTAEERRRFEACVDEDDWSKAV